MMKNGMNGVMVIGGENIADLEKGLEMLKRMVEGGCPQNDDYSCENDYDEDDDDDYGYDYDDDCYGDYDDEDDDDDYLY